MIIESVIVSGTATRPVMDTLGGHDTAQSLQGVALDAIERLVKETLDSPAAASLRRHRDQAYVRCTFEVYVPEEES